MHPKCSTNSHGEVHFSEKVIMSHPNTAAKQVDSAYIHVRGFLGKYALFRAVFH